MVAEGYQAGLLPGEDPPERWISGEVRQVAATREGLERSSTLWTYAIFEALTRGALQWRATDVWLLQVELGLSGHSWVLQSRWPTAVVGLTWGRDTAGWTRFGITLFVQGLEAEREPAEVASAWLPGAEYFKFPVVVVPIVFEEHQGSVPPPNPRGGLATCWARDGGRQDGILTAKHNVNGIAQGASVRLGSSNGTLVAKAPGPVDAAFLALGSTRVPSTAQPVSTQVFPAMSTAVEVVTVRGVAYNSIASVDWTYGVFNNANFPIKVYLGSPHSPGDSGGLVLDAATKEGVALYLGSLNVPTTARQPGAGPSGTLGFSQHLHQAEQILGLSLFR